MNAEKRPRLENWSLIVDNSNPYLAPEAREHYLKGEVYEHPVERHYDGKGIVTSRVLELERDWARTQSREYDLGEPDSEYLEWCAENEVSFFGNFV